MQLSFSVLSKVKSSQFGYPSLPRQCWELHVRYLFLLAGILLVCLLGLFFFFFGPHMALIGCEARFSASFCHAFSESLILAEVY